MVNPLLRRWKGLPDPHRQRQEVERLRAELHLREESGRNADERVRAATLLLEERIRVDESLAPFEKVPGVAFLRDEVQRLQELVSSWEELEKLCQRLAWFERTYLGKPEAVLLRAEDFRQELNATWKEAARLEGMYTPRMRRLSEQLSSRLELLQEWGLTHETPVSLEGKLRAIQKAHQGATSEYGSVDVNALQGQVRELNERIRQIEEEILAVQDQLKRVEEILIGKATIVATTLTRAYLRESIQARRFDTVILDEASMAPIPALWIAAGLADASVVVVGDFKQLPPIVLSSHPLAEKWLGRDVFEVAGIQDAVEKGYGPAHLVQLKCQHRMHAAISSICNQLVYDGTLRNSPKIDEARLEECLSSWCQSSQASDFPVLLVDIGPLEAWVTSVPRGKSSSRLNILSATVGTHIAECLLRPDRKPLSQGQPYRVLLCCPYRPHASLVQLLVNDRNLNLDVLSGTAHTFQGKEADVVIVDLVNDEPHWRVAMFQRDRDESTKKLLNVAFTRARRRLIVLGDFSYIRARGRKAFLGHRLVPFLQDRFKNVEAGTLVSGTRDLLTNGKGDDDKVRRRIFAAREFWEDLAKDIRDAKESVVAYSPALSEAAIEKIEPSLRAANDALVRLYLVTKADRERNKEEAAQHRHLELRLQGVGVKVIHKLRMREKLALIDDRIAWVSSLPLLAYSDEEGLAERRVSPLVAKEYASVLWMKKLLRGHDEQEMKCPICGSEMMAAEGDEVPFYWRCAQDGCYSRSADEPFLRDGVVSCKSCSAPVYLGEWGHEPHWRCKENPRHRQRVHKNHLKLPKMRDLVPKRELRKLEKHFGLIETQPPPKWG